MLYVFRRILHFLLFSAWNTHADASNITWTETLPSSVLVSETMQICPQLLSKQAEIYIHPLDFHDTYWQITLNGTGFAFLYHKLTINRLKSSTLPSKASLWIVHPNLAVQGPFTMSKGCSAAQSAQSHHPQWLNRKTQLRPSDLVLFTYLQHRAVVKVVGTGTPL